MGDRVDVVVLAFEVVSGPIALCLPSCKSSAVTLSAAAWVFWSGTDDSVTDCLLPLKAPLKVPAREPNLNLPSLLGRFPVLPTAVESGTEVLSDRGMLTKL